VLSAAVLAVPAVPVRAAAGQATGAGPALRIVVIAGEDAVNVIQQKTAVAPIVEVRDRNDQPVAGVLVRFVVRGGKGATLNGQTALTITTDAAGRAAVSSFVPTTAGPLEIDVTANFGKDVFSTTIRQRTFQTAADAAKAGSSSSSTSASAGAAGGGAAAGTTSAAGGGGGMSATTIGLIAAGAGAGILVAAKAGGGGGSSGGSGGGTGPGSSGGGSSAGGSGGGGAGGGGTTQNLTVSGPFSLTVPIGWTYAGGLGSCSWPWTRSGTLRMALQVQPSGAVTGTATMTASTSTGAITCSFLGGSAPGGGSTGPSGDATSNVSGTTGNVVFNESTTGGDQTGSFTWTLGFTGALSGGVVTGTLREDYTWANIPGVTVYGGSGSTAVTLR
jgi:hypothetical protein